MTPINATSCVRFINTFFDTTSLRMNEMCRLIMRAYNSDGSRTLAPVVEDWNSSEIPITESNLEELRKACGGSVCILPWFVMKQREGRVGPVTTVNLNEHSKYMPGFYVDLPTESDTGSVGDFLRALEREGVPPTFVTNEPLSVGGRERMWWAVQGWDQGGAEGTIYEPYQTRSTNLQLAWFAYIQKLARKHEFAESMPVDPRFRLDSMMYGLPGVDSSIAYIRSPINLSVIEPRLDHHLTEIMRIQDELSHAAWVRSFGAGGPAIHTMLWDNVLTPLGWTSAGLAPGRREHYWKSPGGRSTAVTDMHELHFWRGQSDWLCGLKEASEAGVQLTRPVVACVLGWDGDIEAFAEHWKRFKTLYP